MSSPSAGYVDSMVEQRFLPLLTTTAARADSAEGLRPVRDRLAVVSGARDLDGRAREFAVASSACRQREPTAAAADA